LEAVLETVMVLDNVAVLLDDGVRLWETVNVELVVREPDLVFVAGPKRVSTTIPGEVARPQKAFVVKSEVTDHALYCPECS
jgi:hypothetical protein